MSLFLMSVTGLVLAVAFAFAATSIGLVQALTLGAIASTALIFYLLIRITMS